MNNNYKFKCDSQTIPRNNNNNNNQEKGSKDVIDGIIQKQNNKSGLILNNLSNNKTFIRDNDNNSIKRNG